MNRITSDTALISIERPFKVSAGPGAGKTYWLTEHMKYVLRRSERLKKTRKIACITYTNVAVDAIMKRMETSADRLEVSTIHSFLYKHVVKPYAPFIADEFGLCVEKMDGHDDVILSNYSFLEEWKTITLQKRIQDNIEIVSAIRKARWRFDGTELVCKPDHPIKVQGYSIKNDSYYKYKILAWAKGVIHHDDVLFFSYQLVDRYPFILTILRAKFSYFFIDEFQDTNPIQAEIIRRIGKEDTVVGVVGDPAQSIYGFQGADLSKFITFNLPGMVSYTMVENRRSTEEIVDALNAIRNDIQQISVSGASGAPPTLIIGEMNDALKYSQELCYGESIQTLTRDNITSNAMKRGIWVVDVNEDTLTDLYKNDKPSSNNKYRSNVIVACAEAVELAREGKFKDAMVAMEKIYLSQKDKAKRRGLALKTIQQLLSDFEELKTASLMEFCLYIKSKIRPEISGLKAGKTKTFYEQHTYQQLALSVNIVEDGSLHKTIHKAKGDEFDNVLLVVKEEHNLGFLLAPDLITTSKVSEEQRIYYVALSRAKKQLFISVPSLGESDQFRLREKFTILCL